MTKIKDHRTSSPSTTGQPWWGEGGVRYLILGWKGRTYGVKKLKLVLLHVHFFFINNMLDNYYGELLSSLPLPLAYV